MSEGYQSLDIDAVAELSNPRAMLLAELADFVTRHRPCGQLTGGQHMKRAIAFLLVAIAATGCAPYLAEVRNQTPTRTARAANADYQTLAGCVAERLQTGESSYWTAKIGNLSYQTVTRTDEERAMLTGSLPSRQHIPVIDLTFRQDGAEVIVESRSGGIGLSRGERFESSLWPAVEKCALGVVISPPLR